MFAKIALLLFTSLASGLLLFFGIRDGFFRRRMLYRQPAKYHVGKKAVMLGSVYVIFGLASLAIAVLIMSSLITST
jgi:hypothetical protein